MNAGLFEITNYDGMQVYPSFEDPTPILSTGDQQVFRIVREGKYGLLSTTRGELLAPEYTDIYNVGSAEVPLFFADQHLDKAGFHVVSYIDDSGKLVLSKAYTREEFDRILCDD